MEMETHNENPLFTQYDKIFVMCGIHTTYEGRKKHAQNFNPGNFLE
jgi:hypothetical protein